MLKSHLTPEAFTLVEVLVAAAVTTVGFLGIMLVNSTGLKMVKSARQSNAATLCLQERAEQMRLADWRKITNETYLRDTLLANSTLSAKPLNGISEKVIVEAFPDADAAQKLVVQRNTNGTRVTLLSGQGLLTQRMARVELQVNWLGADGRPRTRATTTLMSNGGISRMNLPAMGSAAGSPTSSTPVPTATPTPSSSGSGGSATPTPTPTATPTPTPAPGKSNGRGNVSGKAGKG